MLLCINKLTGGKNGKKGTKTTIQCYTWGEIVFFMQVWLVDVIWGKKGEWEEKKEENVKN
jgi:hypothetical protein